MHELSLISEVIEQVSRDACERGIEKVNSVTLTIGSLSHVQPESLKFCFDLAKQQTILHDAALEIIKKEGNQLEIVEYEGEQAHGEHSC
ncbi:hydrogenase maturation nickel metallochaperone HypA/HybF [Dethiobacter alkaliphilus]|uniref:hydrogenase maturation nickel metallochaperone HypA/HybF n=1 Tax=Dethiobacter alkaliphilus TaxID=427926 RepID=UPI0022267D5C|nr:hydrogenase maturation nickel metallochaperone HypA [Dethiobacter alkaliphilus]MCW3490331.1 hydrogenase maturation nickel metallochaperone HypA [Dethiobacter alkaliphilus]